MTYSFRPARRSEATRDAVPIPGWPSYWVTPHGDVVSKHTGKILLPAPRSRKGYLAVSLWDYGKGKTMFVHQIVALAFHGPRPSPKHHAAHDDGNKLNNHRTNIFWKTRIENERDKIAHGRSNQGDRNGMSKAARMRRRNDACIEKI